MAGLLSGLISWFGGPNDSTTGSTTASGAPTSTPGIAVYNRATLGGWWLLKLPNGVVALTRQTDIGPAPSTGRKFDFTFSILKYLGYSQSTFPTNAQANGVYLGKASDIAHLNGTAISDALAKVGANPTQQASLIAQLDAGSGIQGASVIAVDTNGKPASTASTSIGSDAVPSNIIPSPSIPDVGGVLSAIWDFLTTPAKWLIILKFAGGAVLVFMALKALTGAQTPQIIKEAPLAAAAAA